VGRGETGWTAQHPLSCIYETDHNVRDGDRLAHNPEVTEASHQHGDRHQGSFNFRSVQVKPGGIGFSIGTA